MTRVLALFVLVLAGAVGAYLLSIHVAIEQRDEAALYGHFRGQQVSIVDSVEWPSDETCFEVDVSELRPAPSQRKFVMVSSFGHDQDNMGFSGEFRAMRDCVAAFDRG